MPNANKPRIYPEEIVSTIDGLVDVNKFVGNQHVLLSNGSEIVIDGGALSQLPRDDETRMPHSWTEREYKVTVPVKDKDVVIRVSADAMDPYQRPSLEASRGENRWIYDYSNTEKSPKWFRKALGVIGVKGFSA